MAAAGAESVTLLIDHIASVFFPGGFSQYSTADMMTHMIRLNTDGSEVYLTDFDKVSGPRDVTGSRMR